MYRSEMVSPVDKITSPTQSDEVERVINGMKINQAAGTDLLYSESFRYSRYEIKNA